MTQELVPVISAPCVAPTELAHVREAWSAFREASAQLARKVEKVEQLAADLSKATERSHKAADALRERRRELGLALLKARAAWPERGPKAKGWGEFLAAEGIEQSTAWRLMEEVRTGTTAPDPARADQPDLPPGFMPTPAVHETPAVLPRSSPRAFQVRAGFDLRFGPWEITLSKEGVVDALITDPPFDARTHDGSDRATRVDGSPVDGKTPDFAPWTPSDVHAFVSAWSPRVRGWMACMTSHSLIPAWQAAYEGVGRLSFAPVPIVLRGMSVRLNGDGPSSWSIYLMVARPRGLVNWGTLDGAYVGSPDPNAARGRGKPDWLLEKIVADYSRPGDLVADPLAGWGSTLHAALASGRRALGSELHADTHAIAMDRARVCIDPDPTSTRLLPETHA